MSIDYVLAPSATLDAAQRVITASIMKAEDLAVDVCIAVTDGGGHLQDVERRARGQQQPRGDGLHDRPPVVRVLPGSCTQLGTVDGPVAVPAQHHRLLTRAPHDGCAFRSSQRRGCTSRYGTGSG